MNDTNITTLIEKLQEAARYYDDPVDENIIKEAADALEALQIELDAALFDKAVAGEAQEKGK